MIGRVRQRIVTAGLFVCVLAASLSWAISKTEDKGKPSEFKYARLKYEANNAFWDPRYGPPFGHDFPKAEQNLLKAISEFTRINSYGDGVIVDIESDDIFKYPFAYLCEVGYFSPNAKEIKNLREYGLRGGFIIVDDFSGGYDWTHFQQVLKQIFPDRPVEPITVKHPIFHSFFDLDDDGYRAVARSYRGWGTFYGVSDEKGRLMMIIDVNNDVSEYWEWADTQSYMTVSDTREALKLGINYAMYALTDPRKTNAE